VNPLRTVKGQVRLALIIALRRAPVSLSVKRRLIWLSQPKQLVASVAVIPDAKGRVLLLRARYSGLWMLPGGVVNAGEDPRTGLLRECREELGLPVTVEAVRAVVSLRRDREILFSFRCAPLDRPPTLSDEHEAWGYVSPDTARPLVRRLVAAALAPGDDLRLIVREGEDW
jgi:8-oxo-dGTP pyrophosphatase MutT (NUDIX family)